MDIHPLVAEAARAHKELEDAHIKWYRFLRVIHSAIRSGDTGLTQKDRADLAYFLKHIFDLYDDLRKEARNNREMLDAILCTVWVAESATPGKKKERSVRGDVALATPRLTVQPKIPSPTSEPTKYGELMRELGVTNEEVITRGVLRLHWPSIVEWCTENSEQAKPLPAGLDPSKNEAGYATTLRKRTDVDLDEYREEAAKVQETIKTEEREDF